MTDHIRNEIAAWVDSEYGNCPVSASELLALIDAQATEIKQLRAELAKPVESSYTAMQLAAMVLSDCGISTDHTALHERVAERIALHEEQLIDSLQKLPKPIETITTDMAVKRLCQALRDDLDYAWSWHCNVAMTAYDAGCPHDVANEGAARFMQLLAGVDTREHFAFSGTQTKVTSPTSAWHDAPEVAALKAERDAAMKDAERYRWLCGQQPWSEALGKSIDAAIANEEGGAV